MDRRVRIRHLQAFCETVRQRSLKRAAETLLLTQPAISRTLAELEEIVGTRLMTRGRGGIALTQAGEFFLPHARASLAALEQGLAGLAGSGAGRAGATLRLGALPSVAARLLPRIVAELDGLGAELRLTILDGPHGYLTGLLRDGRLDAVIGRLGEPATMQGLSFTQLYLEQVAVVVRPGHPILDRPELRRIPDWPVIYPAPGSAIRPFVERLLIAEGIPLPPRRIETVSGEFGRIHVRQSDAIWFISAGVVARDVAEGLLVTLPLDTPLTEGPVGLMRRARPGDADPPAPEAALELLHRAALRAVSGLGLSQPG